MANNECGIFSRLQSATIVLATLGLGAVSALFLLVATFQPMARAQPAPDGPPQTGDNQDAKAPPPAAEPPAAEPPVDPPGELEDAPRTVKLPAHLVALDPKQSVVLDTKRKRVILQGKICLNRGPLEVFACLRHTKEHEAIVSIDTEAKTVHAALVATGADPGHPALWQPQYEPAEGPEIAVTVFWTDAQGKRQRARAQDWLRNARTGEPMENAWVFGGSMTLRDEKTGKEHYLGEEGFLISVSNFTSAVLDVPVESSASNAGLLFECIPEGIPEVGTRVQIVLTPKKPAEDDGQAEPGQAAKSPPPANLNDE